MLEHPDITRINRTGYAQIPETEPCSECGYKLKDGYYNENTGDVYCDMNCARKVYSDFEIEEMLNIQTLFYTVWSDEIWT